MAVDLTALEKYNELSLDDRDSLGSLSSEDPEVTLAIASRQLETSKTVNSPVVTMEDAVGIYKDLLNFHMENSNPSSPDDFVFFQEFRIVPFALQTM